jgi:LysR family nitrogen assimilation transcriptional regulator
MISLVEGYNQILQEWMLADRIDLAIMTRFEGHPLLESSPLYDESLWLLGPREKQGPQRRNFTIGDLVARPLIQTSHENTLRIMLERASKLHGFALNIVIQAEALSVIKDLVRRGVGYHVSPYSAVVGDVERGDFSGGPIRDLSISRFLVYRNDRPVTRAVSEMSKLIVEELRKAAVIAGPLIRVAPSIISDNATDH